MEESVFFLGFSKIMTCLVGVFFIVLSFRMFKSLKHPFLLRDVVLTKDSSYVWPKVSLIVPICNEEDTIEQAALLLFAIDYPDIEFVFVNDRSTDNTLKILNKLSQHEPRMTIVTIHKLPDGWLGKLNALEVGRRIAKGDLILFSDADVHYQPKALKKAIIYKNLHNLDFLSVLPSIVGGTFIVRTLLAQTMHYFTLAIDLSRVQDPQYSGVVAHGAFMLVNKKAYENSKGFEWLKMEVIDDVGFAAEIKKSGAKVGILSGLDEIEFEWYPNLKTLIHGFEKNSFAAIQYSLFFLLFIIIAVFTMISSYTVLPFFTKNVFYMIFIWSALLLYLCTAAISLRRIIQVHFLTVFLFPIMLPMIVYITTRSAIKCIKQKGIYWRGTFYPLNRLKKEQRLRIIKISPQK